MWRPRCSEKSQHECRAIIHESSRTLSIEKSGYDNGWENVFGGYSREGAAGFFLSKITSPQLTALRIVDFVTFRLRWITPNHLPYLIWHRVTVFVA